MRNSLRVSGVAGPIGKGGSAFAARWICRQLGMLLSSLPAVLGDCFPFCRGGLRGPGGGSSFRTGNSAAEGDSGAKIPGGAGLGAGAETFTARKRTRQFAGGWLAAG